MGTERLDILSGSSGSCWIAWASANCRMPRITAMWAATRWGTSRGRGRCSFRIWCAWASRISSRWHILRRAAEPAGSYGKGATRSPGKDTTTGHWEMAGIWLEQAFPVYPHGFPKRLIEEFERQIGRRTLGNKPASGTEIHQGAGRGARAHRLSDRLHVRRQRVSDRRARRRDPRRRALSHVRDRAEAARWAEPRGPRDRAAVHRRGWKFPAHRTPARLRRRAAAADAAGCAGGTQRAGIRRRQNSRYLQWARRGRLRHDEKQCRWHGETHRGAGAPARAG